MTLTGLGGTVTLEIESCTILSPGAMNQSMKVAAAQCEMIKAFDSLQSYSDHRNRITKALLNHRRHSRQAVAVGCPKEAVDGLRRTSAVEVATLVAEFRSARARKCLQPLKILICSRGVVL